MWGAHWQRRRRKPSESTGNGEVCGGLRPNGRALESTHQPWGERHKLCFTGSLTRSKLGFSHCLFPVTFILKCEGKWSENEVKTCKSPSAAIPLCFQLPVLSVVPAFCSLQHKTGASTWIYCLQELQQPMAKRVDSIPWTETSSDSVLLQFILGKISGKLLNQVGNSQCEAGSWLFPHCCLKIKAEFSSENLNFWFKHELEHESCLNPARILMSMTRKRVCGTVWKLLTINNLGFVPAFGINCGI